jgi:UPF0755 protein
MGKRRFTLVRATGIVIVIAAILVAYAAYAYLHKVDIGDRVVSVIIKQGDGFTRVGRQLLKEGVVDSRRALFYGARFKEVDRKLIPGRYDFTGENSCHSVLTKLERGDFVMIRVTVHEGDPIWKVAQVLAEKLEVDSTAVIELNADQAFLAQLKVPCLEGYLFPETYFFPWGTNSKNALGEMVHLFFDRTKELWPDTLPGGHTPEDIVILASIIEAEALLESEKPTIASVYQNRLNRKMKLDADPTVIYGLGGLDRPLWRRDLRKDTPYNTYRRRGLPPTPINSPGLSAIRAALNPEETDYLFFVADGTGGHHFSRTNAEHNRARHEVKQSMNNSGN